MSRRTRLPRADEGDCAMADPGRWRPPWLLALGLGLANQCEPPNVRSVDQRLWLLQEVVDESGPGLFHDYLHFCSINSACQVDCDLHATDGISRPLLQPPADEPKPPSHSTRLLVEGLIKYCIRTFHLIWRLLIELDWMLGITFVSGWTCLCLTGPVCDSFSPASDELM
jgi:hypothetical protein